MLRSLPHCIKNFYYKFQRDIIMEKIRHAVYKHKAALLPELRKAD